MAWMHTNQLHRQEEANKSIIVDLEVVHEEGLKAMEARMGQVQQVDYCGL